MTSPDGVQNTSRGLGARSKTRANPRIAAGSTRCPITTPFAGPVEPDV